MGGWLQTWLTLSLEGSYIVRLNGHTQEDDVDIFKRVVTSYTFLVGYRVLIDLILHRSSINNNASLSNKFRGFYFIFKFGISGLLHQVITTIADRIRDPIPEVKDAYNVVSREESYREVPESYGVTESKINDWKREKVLGIGSETGGLYMFAMNNDCSVGKSNVVMSFHVSKLLWHNRLGHSDDQVLSVLKNDLSISKNSFVPMCEVCHRAKQTRKSYPVSNHKSKSLGELVHLDLWGSYRVPSRE
ncbi:ribonuclease H-like domain-containing protein [Tanacetum coccineum]